MTRAKAFDIDNLIEGSLRLLRVEAEYFSRLTDHAPELGRLNETHLVKLLRAYLPPKIGIGTGFIICGGDNPRQSPQCDLVLYDSLNSAPFYKSDTWSIYPIEMVYGVIEVKTTLSDKELEDAFGKCAKIRAMARTPGGSANKAYIIQVPTEPNSPAIHQVYYCELPPRFFIFAYRGWKTSIGLERNFKKISDKNQAAHVHGVCSLCDDGSFYIHHRAYRTGEERFSNVSTNGFRSFLTNLPITLESMIPVRRNGLGFDQTYLKHYDLEVTHEP